MSILNDMDFNAPSFDSFITHLHQVHCTLPFLQAALGGGYLVPLPPTPPPLFVFGRQLQREVGCYGFFVRTVTKAIKLKNLPAVLPLRWC
jgi:hypothetical protein